MEKDFGKLGIGEGVSCSPFPLGKGKLGSPKFFFLFFDYKIKELLLDQGQKIYWKTTRTTRTFWLFCETKKNKNKKQKQKKRKKEKGKGKEKTKKQKQKELLKFINLVAK